MLAKFRFDTAENEPCRSCRIRSFAATARSAAGASVRSTALGDIVPGGADFGAFANSTGGRGGAEVRKSWEILKNAAKSIIGDVVAKIGFDTTENGPSFKLFG